MGNLYAVILKLICWMVTDVVEELTAGQALFDFQSNVCDHETQTRAAVHHAAFNPRRANNQ